MIDTIRGVFKQFKCVGGIHGNTVFYAVGDWFKILGGVPDKGSVYVEIFGRIVSR